MVTVHVHSLCNAVLYGLSDNFMAIRRETVQLVGQVLLKCQLIGHSLHDNLDGCHYTGVHEEVQSEGYVVR